MSTTKPIILIIDDCVAIAVVIARHLQSAGCRTIVVASADEARAALARVTPDCVVLDLMMPGLTGAEFLHGFRRDPKTAGIAVVLASARVGYGTHASSQLDADYAVGKPFSREQIIQAVQLALAKRRSVTITRRAS